jgi:Trk K+ transport system NAD-binding subunit
VLRRTDLVRAYDIALTRRTTMRHTAASALGAFSGTQVIEVTIEAAAPCANRRVGEVSWPRDCVLAAVRRGRQTLLPHGDTMVRPGDVLVAVVEGEAREQVQALCRAPLTAGTHMAA